MNTVQTSSYRLIFKDKDKKPIRLTYSEAEGVKDQWRKKQIIEIIGYNGLETFSYTEVKAISPVENEYIESQRYFTPEHVISRQTLPDGSSELIWEFVEFEYSGDTKHKELSRRKGYYKDGNRVFV